MGKKGAGLQEEECGQRITDKKPGPVCRAVRSAGWLELNPIREKWCGGRSPSASQTGLRDGLALKDQADVSSKAVSYF